MFTGKSVNISDSDYRLSCLFLAEERVWSAEDAEGRRFRRLSEEWRTEELVVFTLGLIDRLGEKMGFTAKSAK